MTHLFPPSPPQMFILKVISDQWNSDNIFKLRILEIHYIHPFIHINVKLLSLHILKRK